MAPNVNLHITLYLVLSFCDYKNLHLTNTKLNIFKKIEGLASVNRAVNRISNGPTEITNFLWFG